MSDSCYLLDECKNLMFDFFAFLNAIQKTQNYKELSQNKPFNVDNKIADAYYRLYIFNSRINSDVSMFFTKSDDQGMSFFDWMFRSKIDTFDSCDDIIAEIEKYEPLTIAYQAMRFYDPYNNFHDKFYREIVASRDLFMEYMNGLNVSTEIRWNIMTYIQRPEESVENLKNYIKTIYVEFANEYKNFSVQLAALNALLRTSIDNLDVDSAVVENEMMEKQRELKLQFLPTLVAPPTNEIAVIGLLFAPNKIVKINASKHLYYAIGVGFLDSYNANIQQEDAENMLGEIFKAFTDGTRIQIIGLLKQKECYNGELSRLLNVPMSSLTHHMEILNSCGFVIKRNVGKRTYYKLNKKQFLNSAALLRKYVEDYNM